MNRLVDDRYIERIHRLAMGLEPLEATRGGRLTHPVWVDIEGVLPWLPGWERRSPQMFRRFARFGASTPVASRHDSCLHAVLYQPGLSNAIDLRIYERNRRYVPRRFRAPLVSLQEVLDAEDRGEAIPARQRARRPVLFPGAAHDVHLQATGMRGRVLREGSPMRWARVEAFLNTAAAPLLSRAHGDDRGEFLLLLPPEASLVSVLADPISVRVVIHGPENVPAPASPKLPGLDRYWDLPLEELPPPGGPDHVASGEQLPAGYVEGASRVVEFQLGRIMTAADGVADFTFNIP